MRRIGLPAACALLLAGPFCFAAVSDSDTGWHVALGRLGAIPHSNALSWAFGSYPWYSTSWLYDLQLAALVRGLPQALGAQVLTFALFAIAVAALCAACAREGSAWVAPAIAVLLVPRLVPRPHVASWAILAAVLLQAPRSTRARLFCVALVALGSNLHAGAAFAAGVLGLEALEAYWRSRRWVELGIAALAGVALLANPGALFNARYLLGNLLGGVTSVVRLKELEPASFALRPAFFVLMPVALFCAARRWRERPALLVASAVFALLGLRAIRMVSEAQMVWAPSLAWGLSRLRWKPVFGIAAAALAALSLRLRVPALSPAWDSTLLPVRAARFLQAHAISGPGFTAFRDGGYLEMAGLPAFIDGRVEAVPPQALLDLQQAELSAPAFQAYLRRLGCEWAITTRVRERLGGWHLLHEAPDWKVVYWDEASEVYVRRDVARFARLPEYLHFHPWGHVVQDLSPRELPLLLDEVDRYRATAPADPFAALVRCVALRRLGSPAAAAACAGQAAP